MTYKPCPSAAGYFQKEWLSRMHEYDRETILRYAEADLRAVNDRSQFAQNYGSIGPEKWLILWLDVILSGILD